MSDRLTASQITDEQLTAVYDERDRLAEYAAALYILLYGEVTDDQE